MSATVNMLSNDLPVDAPRSSFAPVNDDHAIIGVTFVLELTAAIPPRAVQDALAPERQAVLPWLAELPAVRPVGSFHLQLESDSAHSSVSPAAGAQFLYLRPDGRPLWALRLMGEQIIVECARYTRWVPVWDQARRYLQAAVEHVRGYEPVEISRVSSSVVDNFVGGRADYNLNELFGDQKELGGRIPFVQSDLWHCFLGWIEPELSGHTLHNLNIQSNGTVTGGGRLALEAAPFSITITHFQQHTPELTSSDFLLVDGAMEVMHQSNKHVLQRLLSDDMLARIGLR